MNINEYLNNRLKTSSKYNLSDEDKKVIQFNGIRQFIYNKLTSKKFRKTSLDEGSMNWVRSAIDLRVSENKPIRFTYPFGAYKLWRIPSFPNVDFAEFFTIGYISEYVAPILTAYKPGVEIVFSSDDVCIELIDNYKRSELDSYNKSFNSLIKLYSSYIPNNLSIELKQVVPDIYSKDEYDKEINELYGIRKKEGFNEDQRSSMLQKMELHFRNNGSTNYGDLTNEEKIKVWEDLTYWSDAYLKLPKRKAFVRAEDNIVLFSNKISNAIDIGSTKASKSKFWTGTGVLENINGHYTEKILSPKQWNEVKNKAKIEKVNIKDNEYLKEVPVFSQRLNFLKN